MLFKKRFPTLLGASVIFVLIVGFIVYMLNYYSPNEYFIFENIDECEQLIPDSQSDLTIERYDTPDKDKKLKGLSYKHFWGMNYQSNELKYQIFAYEFVDSDSALKYYINVTGQKSYEKKLPLSNDDDNKLLSSAKGMSYYRIVAVYQNKAYLLIAPKQYAEGINNLLANTFSYKLL